MSTGTYVVRTLVVVDCTNVMCSVTEHVGLVEGNSCYEIWKVFCFVVVHYLTLCRRTADRFI
jgi:hypothetical protein